MVATYTNSSLVTLLEYITIELSRSVAVIIFLFGTVGNVLNIFILSQRSLRSNSCAWLFLVSSIINLISILFGLITELISGWTADPAGHINAVCKIRAYVVFTTRTIGPFLIALATIDRWLLSSTDARLRQKSTLKNSQRWTIVTFVSSILLYIQIFYCYEANIIDTPLKCYGRTPACRYLTDMSFAFITILCPLILMIVFGLLTISNIRTSHRRIQSQQLQNVRSIPNKTSSSNNASDGRSKQKTDRNLLRMLLVQVLLLCIFTFPLSLQKFYSSFASVDKTPEDRAINVFLYNLAVLTYFISNGIPFYIYTLCGGNVFRKALKDFLIMVKRKVFAIH